MATKPADHLIASDGRKNTSVELVGVRYDNVRIPKAYANLQIAALASSEDMGEMLGAITKWIKQAFGKEGADEILERLESEDDDLDLEHIMKLVEAMAEAATPNPTT